MEGLEAELGAGAAPEQSPSTALLNMPAALTLFVGRAGERAQCIARLHDPACRLLTITGAGGIGKTRLSLEVVRQIRALPEHEQLFVNGVALVPLAPLGPTMQADRLATAIASALGLVLAGRDAPLAQVAQFVREKALLLVLDNCEHLRESFPAIASLLEAAPELKILATSRERLNLRGEQVIELAGLPVPADAAQPPAELLRYEATQLFVQIARAADPAFALTAENAPDVLRICQLVDGVPLGIELAAAWMRVLSCREIADEVAESLDFLMSTNADRPARQQSLRAVFNYSWELLNPAERQALRQLAIFPGRFTREAAAAVVALGQPVAGAAAARRASLELLTLLSSLVDKSLLRRPVAGDEARYEVLEPVRQYAAEQLEQAGESAAASERHAAFYAAQLARHAASLRGAGQQRALKAIEREIEHVRAAWRWAAQGRDHTLLGQAAASLFHFYDMRSWFHEGAEMFGAASAALAGSSSPEAQLVHGHLAAREGWFLFYLGQQTEAKQLLERSLAQLRGLGARAELIFPLNYLGAVCSYLGDYAATGVHCREALALAEAEGDQNSSAIACNILGQAAFAQGQPAEARRWHHRSLAYEQQTGNQWSMAFSLMNLGKVAYALGEYDEARRLYEQAMATREAVGDIRGVALSLHSLGDTAVALNDAQAAAQRYAQSLALFRQVGNQWGMATALIELGGLALRQGRAPAAARLLHEALWLAEKTRSTPQIGRILRALPPIVRAYGEPALAERLAEQATEGAAPEQLRELTATILGWSWAEADRLLSELPTLGQALDEVQLPAASAASAAPAAPPARGYPAGLTQREVEVLRLVAQGLTDAQVAELLVVSRRTVSTHLTSIYGKLQINSRSAATRFALEHGLA